VLEKRKKISKKQIKEDKLVTSYYQAISFFQDYQAKILIGAGIVAVIIVAVILWNNQRSSNNLKAAELLSKVIPLYDAGSYKDAVEGQKVSNITGLKEIVEKYGNSEQGEVAKIYLANSYSLLGNDEAAYKIFDDYSGSIPEFKAAALAGKAAYMESKKDYEKASDLYKDASKVIKSNPSNPEYLMKAGIDLINIGKKDEAKKLFETIKKEYKTSPVVNELDRYMVQVQS
jgi:TolA-binding protein